MIEGDVSVSKREKSVYVGGESRVINTSNTLDMAIAFQTGSWTSGQHMVAKLL